MYSHHHEVKLAVSRAHSFKFKCDAAKLCPRLSRHGGGEPDNRMQKGSFVTITTASDYE